MIARKRNRHQLGPWLALAAGLLALNIADHLARDAALFGSYLAGMLLGALGAWWYIRPSSPPRRRIPRRRRGPAAGPADTRAAASGRVSAPAPAAPAARRPPLPPMAAPGGPGLHLVLPGGPDPADTAAALRVTLAARADQVSTRIPPPADGGEPQR